ncbi:hypothetical protein C4K04_2465 [Pseudomonas chlororaphis]|uniref:Uncharacterized protein n=1 Tax=Pseudomonas chlororaphis TaxID=587753 RepID=A0A3G7TNR2_9PSED|nr:hypothetical protein C4K04_2465 [Pseudomonas chlororaphis]
MAQLRRFSEPAQALTAPCSGVLQPASVGAKLARDSGISVTTTDEPPPFPKPPCTDRPLLQRQCFQA